MIFNELINNYQKKTFISVKNCLTDNYKFARFVRLDDFQRADKNIKSKFVYVKNCLTNNYKFARFVRLDNSQRADKKL
jgi:hypothetical protein